MPLQVLALDESVIEDRFFGVGGIILAHSDISLVESELNAAKHDLGLDAAIRSSGLSIGARPGDAMSEVGEPSKSSTNLSGVNDSLRLSLECQSRFSSLRWKTNEACSSK